jgi:hypothetical protein
MGATSGPKREMISSDGRPPSPLWVRAKGPKPPDWQERLLSYLCSEGAREQLVALKRIDERDERTLYLTGAADALRKTGLTLERWLDGLDALEERQPDALWRRALADEQAARQRQVWELLVELIGFSGTDEPRHWTHHAALLRLRDRAARLDDAWAFFECRPASFEVALSDAADEVALHEQELGEALANCWYAGRRVHEPADRIAKTGVRALSSQRSRLRQVLTTATPTERVALGISYHRLYSRLSHYVHASVRARSDEASDSARGHGSGDVSVDELRWGTIVVGRLGSLCLTRLQDLTGIPGGAVCRLNREAQQQASDPHQDMLFAISVGDVRIGDFALVDESLAEVLAREVNALGHARYLVFYVAEGPGPGIVEEWRPATDVHTLWGRKTVERWLQEFLSQTTEEQRDRFLRLDAGQRLRVYLAAAWDASLRDQVLAELRRAQPVDYS